MRVHACRHAGAPPTSGSTGSRRSRSSWSTCSCFAAIFTGVTTTALVLCAVLYFGRMFFITAGYHRYFSHRSLQDQPGLPVRARLRRHARARRRAPLWWAAHHRDHHRYSDTERDVHSPAARASGGATSAGSSCDKYNETRPRRASRTSPSTPSCGWLNKHDWIAAVDRSAVALLPDRRLVAAWSSASSGRPCCCGTAPSPSTRSPTSFGRRRYATDRHQPQLAAASRSLTWARAGTTTTTTTRPRRARASSGGRSTSPTTCSRC